jgi:hypothetical protein
MRESASRPNVVRIGSNTLQTFTPCLTRRKLHVADTRYDQRTSSQAVDLRGRPPCAARTTVVCPDSRPTRRQVRRERSNPRMSRSTLTC